LAACRFPPTEQDSNPALAAYLNPMPQRLLEPCIPTRSTIVPSNPHWIHEVKHDGYRLIVQKDRTTVRLFTRNGHDWTDRYPLIVEAALRNRSNSFVNGEAGPARAQQAKSLDHYARSADYVVRMLNGT
jgi:ATP-dependent DNA ligase